MSRIDQHIARAQQKLAFNQFVAALALAAQLSAAAVIVGVVTLRLLGRPAPMAGYLLLAIAAIALTACGMVAFRRRPSRMDAAVAIDRALQLKEQFSTALYARGKVDPVAISVVDDAERAAGNVSLADQFRVQWPRRANAAIALIVLALLAAWLVPNLNLWPSANHSEADDAKKQKIEQTQQTIRNALAKVDAAPPALANDPAVQAARAQLTELLRNPTDDPNEARDAAISALQNLKAALEQQIAKDQKYAEAREQSQMLSTLNNGADPNNPVNQASQQMSQGNYQKAADLLHQAVSDFDHMTDAQQQQTIDAMSKLADQMTRLANDPAVAQQLAQQFQQMGASAQQSQDMAKLMQKAAQGDPQAQQQLQDLEQKLQSQANGGKGLTPQQQDQINKMLAQMQAKAAAQANAQHMAQAAKKMANAMQKQHDGIKSPVAMRKGSGKSDQSGDKKGDSQDQSGQQGQNSQGQDQNGQDGQQANAQGNEQQSGEQMSQGDQQMSDALTQMDAVAADAQQSAAAAQAAKDGAGDMTGDGNGAGQGGGQGAGQGANGQGGNGQGGAGGQMGIQKAPFKMAPRIDQSQNSPGGRILAATLVKGDQIKGEAKAQMQSAAASGQQQAADDVDEDSVTGPQQKVIQQYFDAIGHDTQPNNDSK